MHVNDSSEFVRRLVLLGELFDALLSPAKQALYFEALRDLPFDEVAAALNAAAKVCTFMPKPAELRKLAVGDDEDQAEQAWLALRGAMRSAGAYASLATEDPALGDTIAAMFGTWPEACHTELSPEMWSSKRKEFGRVYRVLRDRGLVGSRYLAGIAEQQNAGRSDWLKYVTVAVLGPRGTIRQLRGDEAETYRTALAAVAGREMSRLTVGVKPIERSA
jgi:hypothetical protein